MATINIRTIRKVFSELGFKEEDGNFLKGYFSFHVNDIKEMKFDNGNSLKEYVQNIEFPFDVNVENEQAVFIDESIKNIDTPIIKRIDAKGLRLYYTQYMGYQIFCSGTNFISMGLPDDMKNIMRYREDLVRKGLDPDEELSYAASFGTIMHILYAYLSMGRKVPGNNKRLAGYIRNMQLKNFNKDHIERLINEDLGEMIECLQAWVFFCKKHNVKVFFIEKMMRSTSLPIATAQDYYVEMDWEFSWKEKEYYKKSGTWGEAGDYKGEKTVKEVRRIKVLLDIKSGDHSYDKHFYQLDCNRTMMSETYGDLCPVDKIVNFHPLLGRNAKNEPRFRLVDWQESSRYDYLMSKREHIYSLAVIDFLRKNFYIEVEDEFDFNIGEYVDAGDKVRKIDIIEFLMQNEL